MRVCIGMTQLGQICEDWRAFDTKLASQIINANLASRVTLLVHTTKMAGQTIYSHWNATFWAFVDRGGMVNTL